MSSRKEINSSYEVKIILQEYDFHEVAYGNFHFPRKEASVKSGFQNAILQA